MKKALVHAATVAAFGFCMALTVLPIRAEDRGTLPTALGGKEMVVPDWPAVKLVEEKLWRQTPTLELLVRQPATANPSVAAITVLDRAGRKDRS